MREKKRNENGKVKRSNDWEKGFGSKFFGTKFIIQTQPKGEKRTHLKSICTSWLTKVKLC